MPQIDFATKDEIEKNAYQAELLLNRLKKRYKHLKKWAKRSDISSYRLYDKDIPEIPIAIDIFQANDKSNTKYAQIALYERPYDKPVLDEQRWLESMRKVTSEVLDIPEDNIIFKVRKIQRGLNQYEKVSEKNLEFTVNEQGVIFFINLTDYLDTGLFFDHRPLRLKVMTEAKGKCVLNLFCYTGSFSVYAAKGNAEKIDSVDLSSKYLLWAEKNMKINGFYSTEKYHYIQSDTMMFLTNYKGKKYDIIILDPPTFSNSKKMKETLDINRDWPILVEKCLNCLSETGILYFSTNSTRLQFDKGLIRPNCNVLDITQETIPEDFRNTKIHRCWQITHI